ncbi:hypothetical protein DFH08DRAFT_818406 [Mycena albidolilacea]|uniref:Transmembrane protein n=1 Tax=Mycena albidolilacea TaxID=1033008 RepID=A0AAD6ZGK8_9AGAR|nr:hypothetical protein DFH08DRAFT_818406 [Mycena albidolilacea]
MDLTTTSKAPRKTWIRKIEAWIPDLERHLLWYYFALCVSLSAVCWGASYGISKRLVLNDISLVANFLDVDATARTVTVDFLPLPVHCSSPEMVVNIFVDPFSVFRTTWKLTGKGSTGPQTRSLQAYPHDRNFATTLDVGNSINNEEGVLLQFTVARSAAVVGLVYVIVVANWIATIAFMWITVAAFMWDTKIVAEMLALPIGALFAFTSIRANFPGAPTGFGAVVDYYGILPNIVLITLFGVILLLGVLYRRVQSMRAESMNKEKSSSIPTRPDQHSGMNQAVGELSQTVGGLNQTVGELKTIVAGIASTVNAMSLQTREPPAADQGGGGPVESPAPRGG